MYKVNPKDVIPTCTFEEAEKLDKANNGLLGCFTEDVKKLTRLDGQLKTMTSNPSVKPEAFLKKAYQFVDLYNRRAASFSVCAKGCSHCCKIPVDISRLEAYYIEINTEFEANQELEPNYKHPPGEYCTFHDPETATCKVHEFRPLACRTFFAFDNPAYCEDPMTKHAISPGNAMHPSSAIKEVFSVLEHSKGNEIGDIRNWFREAK